MKTNMRKDSHRRERFNSEGNNNNNTNKYNHNFNLQIGKQNNFSHYNHINNRENYEGIEIDLDNVKYPMISKQIIL